ncbi:MAG: hypothetical protein GXP32_05950, partial [Kiritimatiellaeota bacterium]|nr:hypothetical protein [Kiritimatiellota bacterium]
MDSEKIYQTIVKITDADPRFAPAAYEFIGEAVRRTLSVLLNDGEARHISGVELLEGIREQALEEFGPMAESVFNHWGVFNTLDIGHIVFNMVDNQLLSSSDKDTIDDFDQVFDLHDALTSPFNPPSGEDVESKAIDL